MSGLISLRPRLAFLLVACQALLALLIASLAWSSPAVQPAAAAGDCTVSSSDVAIDTEEQAMLNGVNAYRQQNGLQPLKFSPALSKSAPWLSTDMATHNYLGHTDSLGRDIKTRLGDCGYTQINNTSWAENVAAGYADAATTLSQWKNSSTHNANLLGASFVVTGIARSYNAASTYKWYWTMDFGGFDDSGSGGTPPPTQAPLAVWRPSNGVWYGKDAGSGTILYQTQWGLSGDIPVAARYTGTTRNLAVWRPANGVWYAKDAQTGAILFQTQWGLTGDIPAPADFTGDGRAELAVWRPSNGTWYAKDAQTGSIVFQTPWGQQGDIPAPADFTGDGRAELTVWTPATGVWQAKDAVTGSVVFQTQWGLSGDVPVPADFTGDGRAELAVWRPANGTWYVKDAVTGSVLFQTQWGLNGDVPVPGDYLGLGHAQFAVWRPANGTWYIRDPLNGTVVQVQWGLNGDQPIAGKGG